jgi:hypothetical protein
MNANPWKEAAIASFLSTVSTKGLTDELAKRTGVSEYKIDPNVKYVVEDETGIYTSDSGPARILVVIDNA